MIPPRYKHQEEFIALPHEQTNRTLLAWEMGTGKSRASIDWAVARIRLYEARCLIICPISVEHKWRTEVLEFAPDYADRFAITTKERFRKNFKELPRFGIIIVDEAHYFSGYNPTSMMSKALFAYTRGHSIQNVIMLTATPYLSKPWNVYRLAQILGHKWDYRDFEREFFTFIPMGFKRIPVVRPHMEARLAEYVHKIGFTKRLDECADVPKSVILTERFDLTEEQKNAIKTLSYDANPIVRFGREHQICGGAIKGDGFRQDLILPCHKRQRVVELANENDKLVVVAHHLLELEAIKQALKEDGIGHVYTITGDTKDREGLIKQASNEEKAVLLVSSACSEGWEFPSARLMVFYSHDFSLKNYIQMTGRIQRINNLAKRTYLTLLIDGSIDEDVHKNISNKKNFHLHIYARENSSRI